jgi:PAS domain S-box-containing protein
MGAMVLAILGLPAIEIVAANHIQNMLLASYLVLLGGGLGLAFFVLVILRHHRYERESAAQHYRSLAEATPDGLAIVDENGLVIYANPALLMMTGSGGPETWLRKSVTKWTEISEDEAAAWHAPVLTRQEMMSNVRMHLRHADGHLVAVEANAGPFDLNGRPGMIWVIRDLTSSRSAQAAKALAEAKALAIIDNITDGIIVYDLDAEGRPKAVQMNPAAQELLGRPIEDLQGEFDWVSSSILDAEGRPLTVDRIPSFIVSRTGEPYTSVQRVRSPGGVRRWLRTTANPVFNHQGTIVGVVISLVDVTQDQADRAASEADRARLSELVVSGLRSEQALRAAEQVAIAGSRQKSVFLATMSHEIRTPMNAVIGMTGLLLETPLDSDQKEFVETIRSSGRSLLGIINNILDFSKIEADGLQLELGPFDVHDCIDDALDLVAATPRSRDVELVGHVDSRCPAVVVGDVTRFRQVLVNLLSNAVKFTSRGHVLLTVETVDSSAVTASGSAEAVDLGTGPPVRLRIAVADTGIGIHRESLPGLFDPFSQGDTSTTRLYGGTGLGLTISHRLVQAMGGELVVDSVAGKGSTFSFTVPFERSPQELGPTVPECLGGRTALLVTDKSITRRMMRLDLESWGMQVTEATSGITATAMVGVRGGFDIALIDKQMPGITGQELADAFHRDPCAEHLPVVLLTSLEDSKALEYEGFAAVLRKPVRRSRLMEVVADVFRHTASTTTTPPSPLVMEYGNSASMRVLMAEDNPINQRVGQLMLEKLGHTVEVVANGQEAVRATGLVTYDAVFMDVDMPEMDGLDATRAIRRMLPPDRQPRIIALTAGALDEDQTACLEAGMNDFLAKPVRFEDLHDALTRAADHGPT